MIADEFIKLNNGLLMPLIGLGTAQCQDEDMRKALRAGLECGYRSIDTAYLYRNEKVIGEELHDWFTKGKLKRDDVFITTKLPAIANRAEDVSRFLKMSLESLKISYLDLYLIHQPFGLKCLDDNNVYAVDSSGNSVLDNDTDLESVWRELEKQVDAGKVKSIGVSNFNSKQLERILKIARIPPVVNQIEVQVSFQQHSLIEKCRNLGVAVVSYSSLGAPYSERGRTVSVLNHPTIMEIGNRYGKSSSQVILKFLIQQGIVVIPKSMNPDRIASNINITDFHLSDEEMKTIYSLDQGENGRIINFKKLFKGCENHKEYPFYLKE